MVKRTDARATLRELATAKGESLGGLSVMLGRNPAYLQQWIARGSPRVLAERDRRWLADFFGVSEQSLGGPPARAGWQAPRLDVAASAGPGALNEGHVATGAATVTPELQRALGLTAGKASVIRVLGDSMAPGLTDGDELLVDETRRSPDARGGVFVLRLGTELYVKRVHKVRGGLVVTSDNPDAAPIAPGEPEVIGQVVWQMRRVQ